MNKHTASILLAQLFIENIRQIPKGEDGVLETSPAYKLSVVEDAYRLLDVLDFYEVRDQLQAYRGEKVGIYSLANYLDVSVRKNRSATELIQLGSFYLHPKLQESPGPRRVLIDYETMEQVREEPEPFYLEIVESFTVEDVLAYYYEKHLMEAVPGNAHFTQIANLTSSYPLDIVLYLIDASAFAKADSEEGGYARAPAFLPNFIEEARDLLMRRKNKLTEGGLTQIVPRELYFK